jgi:capsule polysaccharide modification protein KpsS
MHDESVNAKYQRKYHHLALLLQDFCPDKSQHRTKRKRDALKLLVLQRIAETLSAFRKDQRRVELDATNAVVRESNSICL